MTNSATESCGLYSQMVLLSQERPLPPSIKWYCKWIEVEIVPLGTDLVGVLTVKRLFQKLNVLGFHCWWSCKHKTLESSVLERNNCTALYTNGDQPMMNKTLYELDYKQLNPPLIITMMVKYSPTEIHIWVIDKSTNITIFSSLY
ncbi:unnamed protein product [Schistosoma bovis]|nr:unnamed protein product [Schistosoma bovis]CAH8534803.1 unnamed protein product [Schistosoma bovis]